MESNIESQGLSKDTNNPKHNSNEPAGNSKGYQTQQTPGSSQSNMLISAGNNNEDNVQYPNISNLELDRNCSYYRSDTGQSEGNEFSVFNHNNLQYQQELAPQNRSELNEPSNTNNNSNRNRINDPDRVVNDSYIIQNYIQKPQNPVPNYSDYNNNKNISNIMYPSQELNIENYRVITKEEFNKICCDCGTFYPKFVSVNNGVVLCTACAEMHLNFGSKVSHLRSINSKWDDYLFLYLIRGGNKRFIDNLVEHQVNIRDNPSFKYRTKAAEYYRQKLRSEILGEEPPMRLGLKEGSKICEEYKNQYPDLDDKETEEFLRYYNIIDEGTTDGGDTTTRDSNITQKISSAVMSFKDNIVTYKNTIGEAAEYYGISEKLENLKDNTVFYGGILMEKATDNTKVLSKKAGEGMSVLYKKAEKYIYNKLYGTIDDTAEIQEENKEEVNSIESQSSQNKQSSDKNIPNNEKKFIGEYHNTHLHQNLNQNLNNDIEEDEEVAEKVYSEMKSIEMEKKKIKKKDKKEKPAPKLREDLAKPEAGKVNIRREADAVIHGNPAPREQIEEIINNAESISIAKKEEYGQVVKEKEVPRPKMNPEILKEAERKYNQKDESFRLTMDSNSLSSEFQQVYPTLKSLEELEKMPVINTKKKESDS
eukprot:CAMPEP_0170516198 /NCGR_PEP_ID=MMETSP0209-20121228/2487_1 /TAXON_ID=665100 ORGANISM="Litonotus pictus, Strain P1" /NCGR_SAMPLE_ID=MMETSP0209 /ASSEMBLY_ACC=CAM_ASM_000301 /LENGTH=648 /DNA_ID=CAMNT_0010801001 /DNA_START=1 /DNA_END=1947 /DNA_ORIENTATION=+